MKKIDLIDKIIKKKLEEVEPSVNLNHWDRMEQLLDEGALDETNGHPVGDAKPVDEAIFEKLHRYEAPYNPSHWEKMEALLNETFTWPAHVVRYKLAELSLMLLLFMFFWQGQGSVQKQPSYSQPVIAEDSREKTNRNGQDNNQLSIVNPDDQNVSSEILQDDEENTITSSRIAEGSSISGVASFEEQKLIAANEAKHLAGSLITKKYTRLIVSPLANLSNRNIKLLPPVYRTIDIDNNIAALGEDEEILSILGLLEPIATNTPDLLAYQAIDLPEATDIVPSKSKGVIRIGMFGSGEVNHILIQPSQEKSAKKQTVERYSLGYGGGLSVGLDKGKWELETGAIYAARKYPVDVIYRYGSLTDGIFGSEIQDGELNIINVPIHFRYNFLRKSKWRVYGVAGGALQLAFQTNYFVVDAPQDLQYQPDPASPPPSPMAGAESEYSIGQLKKESIGLFEGGAFNDNAYISGNVGFGVERYVTEQWSIFSQPVYQYSLHYFREGVGPNKDGINSLSILIGAKVRLE